MSLPVPMTFLSIDMDRPLNIAHWHERKAETQLKQGKWDDAEKSYSQAAEQMRKALSEVSSTSIAAPIKMQVDQLEKMKGIIDIKRKEASRQERKVHNSPVKIIQSGRDTADLTMKETALEGKMRANSTDKGTETSDVESTGIQVMARQDSMRNAWQLIQMTDAGDRPKDSLIPQFLRRDIEENRLGLDSKKIPKSQEALLEEYRTRLALMQDVMQGLLKEIQDKEEENKTLKEEVYQLRSEAAMLSERLEVYEGRQNFRPLQFDEREPLPRKFSGDMTASMLMNQPESYFEFDGKALERELNDALEENIEEERRRKATPPTGRGFPSRYGQSENQSVQYQDLDDGVNAEVSEAFSNSPAESNSGGSSLRLASLAGLPPLSPVHFELDDKDNIFGDKHGDVS